jgi:hypothetical protein
VNETLVEAKLCTFTLECTHFVFNKHHIYTHDGASAKFGTNSHERDNINNYFFPRKYGKPLLNQKNFVIKSKPNSLFDVEIAAGEDPKIVFAINTL